MASDITAMLMTLGSVCFSSLKVHPSLHTSLPVCLTSHSGCRNPTSVSKLSNSELLLIPASPSITYNLTIHSHVQLLLTMPKPTRADRKLHVKVPRWRHSSNMKRSLQIQNRAVIQFSSIYLYSASKTGSKHCFKAVLKKYSIKL